MYGDGRQFVGDVVVAFLAAGDATDAQGAANVATGRETTVLELGSALGLDLDRAEERAGEVRRSCLARSLRGRADARLDGPRTAPRGLERTLAAMRG